MKLAGNSHSDGEPIPFTWYDGKILPQPSSMGLPADFSLPQNVVVVVGEKGTIMVPQGGDGYAYFRKGKQRPMEMPEARGGSHWHLWVDRARGGDRPCLTPIEYGGRVSETLAIGVIASQFPNQPLEWDAKSMSFPASPEATAYVTRKYRPGWQAKGLG